MPHAAHGGSPDVESPNGVAHRGKVAENAAFAELDALRQADILTEAEYSEALRRLGAYAVQPAPGRRRAAHRKASRLERFRWLWIAATIAILSGAIIAVAANSAGDHKSGPPTPIARSAVQSDVSTTDTPAAIVTGAAVDTALAINLKGATAMVTVSTLTPDPPEASGPAKAGRTRSALTTYSATVSASGETGTFTLDPAYFSARSASGQVYPAGTGAAQSVTAGGHGEVTVTFLVPVGQHIAVVLLTTPLGEQLGLWAVS